MATSAEHYSGLTVHKAMPKYHFKSQHDWEGKDSKDSLKKEEQRGHRLSTAYDAFQFLVKTQTKTGREIF
eukprot:13048997-Ditylum_brightwellii.AAC.1